MKILNTNHLPKLSFVGLLIWFLIFLFLGPLSSDLYSGELIQISFTFMLLFAVFTLTESKKALIIGGTLAIISIIANGYVLHSDTFLTEFWSLLASFAFILFTVIYLFRSVFFYDIAKVDLIFGSICVYILIGLMWAVVYSMIELCSPGSFLHVISLNGISKFESQSMPLKTQTFLYFSLVTQTTLGYGDITPATLLARNVATVQSVMGVFYLATLVGGVVKVFNHKEKPVPKN